MCATDLSMHREDTNAQKPKQMTVHERSSKSNGRQTIGTESRNHMQAQVELAASEIIPTVVSEANHPRDSLVDKEGILKNAIKCGPKWSSPQTKSIRLMSQLPQSPAKRHGALDRRRQGRERSSSLRRSCTLVPAISSRPGICSWHETECR